MKKLFSNFDKKGSVRRATAPLQTPAAKIDGLHSAVSYPKREHNRIETYLEGTDFYTALYEHCRNAHRSIWCAVSFGSWSFTMPNGEHWWSFFQSLKRENPKLTIRVLFWRNSDDRWQGNSVIMGTQKDANAIAKYKLHEDMQLKWDESPDPSHCHHGKYFIIDAEAGTAENEQPQVRKVSIADIYCFVGGMTLCNSSYDESIHDTVLKLHGPCVIDVVHNFKLRWNHNNTLSECAAAKLCAPLVRNIADYEYTAVRNEDANTSDEHKGLDSMEVSSDSSGSVGAQIGVTICPDLYPGYKNGESSIHALYYNAFYNATTCIYMESQHPGELQLLRLMRWKLETVPEFRILFVVPMRMMRPIKKAKLEALQYRKHCENNNTADAAEKPRYYDMFEMLASLKQFKNFSLCGMYKSAGMQQTFDYQDMYVHSKLCIVDGQWFTIGSANFVDISLVNDHSEINVFVFDVQQSMKLLRKLAYKHLEKSALFFDEMNKSQIVKYMMKAGRENVKRLENKKTLNGRLYQLDPETYANP